MVPNFVQARGVISARSSSTVLLFLHYPETSHSAGGIFLRVTLKRILWTQIADGAGDDDTLGRSWIKVLCQPLYTINGEAGMKILVRTNGVARLQVADE